MFRNIYNLINIFSTRRNFLGVAFLVTVLFNVIYFDSPIRWGKWQTRLPTMVSLRPQTESQEVCPFRKLDPFADEMTQFLRHLPRFNCSQRKESREIYKGSIFRVERGHFLVQEKEVNLTGKICCYKRVSPAGDESVSFSSICTTIKRPITNIPVDYTVIEVTCRDAVTKAVFYRDGFGLIAENPKVEERIHKFENKSGKPSNITEDDDNLSVIIIGLDSISQMHFLRKLPKTASYLTENLGAFRLNRYNKIAENTLPNILGSISGRTMKEFREECVDDEAGIFDARLHTCSFIWKLFAERGYRTGYSEDEISISIFNLYFGYAFEREKPTDYYWRPHSILMENLIGSKSSYCYGPRLSFETLMHNVKMMADVFKHKRYFKFTYSTKLGHEDFNAMAWGDEPLLDAVKYLHTEGHLNNTALIIIGDHGFRGHDEVEQAMLENRQPAAYIALPPWFQDKYPEAFSNLKENAENSLTVPYDLYRTLLDMMNLKRLSQTPFPPNPLFVPITEPMKLRGVSLFEKIPLSRNCTTAQIPLMWCTCHQRISLDRNSSLVAEVGRAIVAHMNSVIKTKSVCARLVFLGVTAAQVLDVRDNLEAQATVERIKNCKHSAPGNCSLFEKNNEIVLHVVLKASPSDVEVETIGVKSADGKIQVPEEIVRKDWFQGKSQCVGRYLQSFCVCQSSLKKR